MSDYPKLSEGILGEETVAKTNTEQFLSLVGQYFPEAIKDGEVDFTALKEEMGEFPEVGPEHYSFTWAGKQNAKKEAQSDLFGKTLRYKPQDSLNPDATENIYIEGDNLEALKLLRRNYRGKIKMIYIDPPYNTGNDFVYNDDFSLSEEELASLSGDVLDGVRYQKNSKDSSKYHTKWLNMMYPRLKIAKELLTDDGVIFISIDENEVSNLKKMTNDIYGERNFVGCVIWERAFAPKNDAKYFSDNHDYVVVYARDISSYKIGKLSRTEEADARYKNPDNDSRGPWTPDNLTVKTYNAANDYPITTPGGRVVNPSNGSCWRVSKKRFEELVADNRIYFGDEGNNVPRLKRFLSEIQDGMTPTTIWKYQEVGHNQEGRQELKKLFDGNGYFDGPKPVRLLSRILQIANTDKESVILDFFSGSATTAHAVMQLNAEDGGKRKFIMVQLPELTDEKSEAYKDGYKNICEIGKERIRRAGAKIKAETGADIDCGFKVFEIGDTTIRWNKESDESLQSITDFDFSSGDRDFLDFTPNHSDIDTVYEIMLRQYGIPLSTPILKMPEISERTYIFADAVAVCLEPEITDELIEKLAAIEPTPAKYILRDSAFGDNIEFKDVSFRKLSALIKNHQTADERRSKYNNYTVEFI